MGEREYYAVLPSINCRRYPVKVVVLQGFRKYARVLQKLYPIVTHDMTLNRAELNSILQTLHFWYEL